jgi:hypothetical protein
MIKMDNSVFNHFNSLYNLLKVDKLNKYQLLVEDKLLLSITIAYKA